MLFPTRVINPERRESPQEMNLERMGSDFADFAVIADGFSEEASTLVSGVLVLDRQLAFAAGLEGAAMGPMPDVDCARATWCPA
jgi:hypothetical protein